jgi:hypothetical protein
MDDLIQIFSRDVKVYSTLISDESFVAAFLASSVDLKTGATLIPDRAIETTMENLLVQYFTSQGSTSPTWTIYLCIGQVRNDFPEENVVVKKENIQSTHKQNRSKKSKKESVVIKVYIIYFC